MEAQEPSRSCLIAVLSIVGGTGEAVSSQQWTDLCLVSIQCIVGFNMVTPQLSHFCYSLVPSVETCYTRTCDHRDSDTTCL